MDSWRRPSVPQLPGHGPEPRLRDTASGAICPAAAGPAQGPAPIYACGITPYDATHIGHAATFTAWDLLVRAWLDAGQPVTYIQNVTDVDDPLLERAERDGEDWRDLAERETQRYRGDMVALRLIPPAHLIGAVEAIPVIEQFAEPLADRGSLYELDGDIYFARAADPAFGALSGLGTPPDSTRRRCGSSRPNAAATRTGRARRTRSTCWSGGPSARRAGLGVPVRPRPARLARGVRGHRHRAAGLGLRRPGRRF